MSTKTSSAVSAQYPVACPTCGVGAFEACRTRNTNRVTDTHWPRIEATSKFRRQRTTPPVPETPTVLATAAATTITTRLRLDGAPAMPYRHDDAMVTPTLVEFTFRSDGHGVTWAAVIHGKPVTDPPRSQRQVTVRLGDMDIVPAWLNALVEETKKAHGWGAERSI